MMKKYKLPVMFALGFLFISNIEPSFSIVNSLYDGGGSGESETEPSEVSDSYTFTVEEVEEFNRQAEEEEKRAERAERAKKRSTRKKRKARVARRSSFPVSKEAKKKLDSRRETLDSKIYESTEIKNVEDIAKTESSPADIFQNTKNLKERPGLNEKVRKNRVTHLNELKKLSRDYTKLTGGKLQYDLGRIADVEDSNRELELMAARAKGMISFLKEGNGPFEKIAPGFASAIISSDSSLIDERPFKRMVIAPVGNEYPEDDKKKYNSELVEELLKQQEIAQMKTETQVALDEGRGSCDQDVAGRNNDERNIFASFLSGFFKKDGAGSSEKSK